MVCEWPLKPTFFSVFTFFIYNKKWPSFFFHDNQLFVYISRKAPRHRKPLEEFIPILKRVSSWPNVWITTISKNMVRRLRQKLPENIVKMGEITPLKMVTSYFSNLTQVPDWLLEKRNRPWFLFFKFFSWNWCKFKMRWMIIAPWQQKCWYFLALFIEIKYIDFYVSFMFSGVIIPVIKSRQKISKRRQPFYFSTYWCRTKV